MEWIDAKVQQPDSDREVMIAFKDWGKKPSGVLEIDFGSFDREMLDFLLSDYDPEYDEQKPTGWQCNSEWVRASGWTLDVRYWCEKPQIPYCDE